MKVTGQVSHLEFACRIQSGFRVICRLNIVYLSINEYQHSWSIDHVCTEHQNTISTLNQRWRDTLPSFLVIKYNTQISVWEYSVVIINSWINHQCCCRNVIAVLYSKKSPSICHPNRPIAWIYILLTWWLSQWFLCSAHLRCGLILFVHQMIH